jgi:hypothetical protein
MSEHHHHGAHLLSGLKSALTSDGGRIAEGGVGGALVGGLAGYAGNRFFGNPSAPGYTIAGHHVSQEQAFIAGGAIVGALAGTGGAAFFNHMHSKAGRDYVIIVDKSGAMDPQRWEHAKSAVLFIAPQACNIDPDGVTLLLYSDSVSKTDNVKDSETLTNILSNSHPGGQSNLDAALQSAFADLFNGKSKKGMTVLVITAGRPSNVNATVDVLRDAANRISHSAQLSVTFVQIGDDAEATAYLKWLDNDLKAKFDVVDSLKDEDLKKAGFHQHLRPSQP